MEPTLELVEELHDKVYTIAASKQELPDGRVVLPAALVDYVISAMADVVGQTDDPQLVELARKARSLAVRGEVTPSLIVFTVQGPDSMKRLVSRGLIVSREVSKTLVVDIFNTALNVIHNLAVQRAGVERGELYNCELVNVDAKAVSPKIGIICQNYYPEFEAAEVVEPNVVQIGLGVHRLVVTYDPEADKLKLRYTESGQARWLDRMRAVYEALKLLNCECSEPGATETEMRCTCPATDAALHIIPAFFPTLRDMDFFTGNHVEVARKIMRILLRMYEMGVRDFSKIPPVASGMGGAHSNIRSYEALEQADWDLIETVLKKYVQEVKAGRIVGPFHEALAELVVIAEFEKRLEKLRAVLVGRTFGPLRVEWVGVEGTQVKVRLSLGNYMLPPELGARVSELEGDDLAGYVAAHLSILAAKIIPQPIIRGIEFYMFPRPVWMEVEKVVKGTALHGPKVEIHGIKVTYNIDFVDEELERLGIDGLRAIARADEFEEVFVRTIEMMGRAWRNNQALLGYLSEVVDRVATTSFHFKGSVLREAGRMVFEPRNSAIEMGDGEGIRITVESDLEDPTAPNLEIHLATSGPGAEREPRRFTTLERLIDASTMYVSVAQVKDNGERHIALHVVHPSVKEWMWYMETRWEAEVERIAPPITSLLGLFKYALLFQPSMYEWHASLVSPDYPHSVVEVAENLALAYYDPARIALDAVHSFLDPSRVVVGPTVNVKLEVKGGEGRGGTLYTDAAYVVKYPYIYLVVSVNTWSLGNYLGMEPRNPEMERQMLERLAREIERRYRAGEIRLLEDLISWKHIDPEVGGSIIGDLVKIALVLFIYTRLRE